ncbi:transposase (plasmid) [Ralstonia syzygii subsp. celebesensis]|nr:transposase [Ralstonia syzygii subsp. celebesensis]
MNDSHRHAGNVFLTASPTKMRTGSAAQAVIPSRAHRRERRPLDRHLYRSRNLVERFFARIKQFRRIATRYDKLAQRFSAFVSIAAAFIWLR